MITIANLAYIFQLYLDVKNNGFVILKKFKRWIPVIVVITTMKSIYSSLRVINYDFPKLSEVKEGKFTQEEFETGKKYYYNHAT